MKTLAKKSGKHADKRPRSWPALLRLYRACMHNGESLLEDARLLFEAKRFPRAYALAFTALEEVGKGQLVADYLTDCASEAEFLDAFRKHETKAAYVARYVRLTERPGWEEAVKAANDVTQRIVAILKRYEATIEYDTTEAKKLWSLRNAALYVCKDDNNLPRLPKDAVTETMAAGLIANVEELLHEIEHAEWLNDRIGSKALFK
jgi:AbiV family abortive infection protein